MVPCPVHVTVGAARTPIARLGGATPGVAQDEVIAVLEEVPGASPAPAAVPPGLGTKLAFAVTLSLLAVLLVTSARTPPPAEGRLGHRVEIMALIEAEQARNEALAAKVEELAAEIGALERDLGVETAEISALQAAVDRLAAPAGMTALRGPGVVTTLKDSSLAPPADGNVNDYVIHEEDLQAVINALWGGGAEAMAVNGQRILATTAIRCVGNVLLLHGSTHSPPYVIAAVGDRETLGAALARDPAVARFQRAVQQFKVGFEVAAVDEVVLPPFEGGTGIDTARPLADQG